MIRASPLVAFLLATAAFSCGCGGPTGKGIHKDRDRPLPEKKASRLSGSLGGDEAMRISTRPAATTC
jgi:hypothetical protein